MSEETTHENIVTSIVADWRQIKMKCKYARENPIKGLNYLCSKNNHPYDISEMGDCIYGNGKITKKASIHCSEGKEILGLKTN